MNKERQTDHLAHSMLTANVLDDPRWEKLALGTASPEEIESLRAWAQHSYMARHAWDLFRPAMEKEKAAITVAVLERRTVAVHNVGEPKFGEQKVRQSLTSASDVQAKPVDARMMSRHARRESTRDFSETVLDHLASKVRAAQRLSKFATSTTVAGEPVAAVIQRRNPASEKSQPGVTSIDAGGTTSTAGVLIRAAGDSSSLSAVHTTAPEWTTHTLAKQHWHVPWFVFGAMALFVVVDMAVGWMGRKGEPVVATAPVNTPSYVPMNVPSAKLIPDVRPEMTVPAKSAADKSDDAQPALSASSMAEGAVSAPPPASTTSASIPPPQVKSLPAPTKALKPKPVYKEVCAGTGMFKRCTVKAVVTTSSIKHLGRHDGAWD